jgi:hypothetical protein
MLWVNRALADAPEFPDSLVEVVLKRSTYYQSSIIIYLLDYYNLDISRSGYNGLMWICHSDLPDNQKIRYLRCYLQTEAEISAYFVMADNIARGQDKYVKLFLKAGFNPGGRLAPGNLELAQQYNQPRIRSLLIRYNTPGILASVSASNQGSDAKPTEDHPEDHPEVQKRL